MNRRKTIIRIIAIILTGVMLLSVVTILFSVFSGSAWATQLDSAPPNTGIAEDWIFYVIGVAVLVAVACMILPRVIKKKPVQDDDDEF